MARQRLAAQIDLFTYEDFRAFLRDWLSAAKQEHSAVSFRWFSSRAGLASPNFLQLVIRGTRNLSTDGIAKFSKALRLARGEATYFANLVRYNQAKEPAEQARYLDRLARARRVAAAPPLAQEHYELFSQWHHSVLRELVVLCDADDPITWCQQRLIPALTREQITHSLQLLERFGLLTRDAQQHWQQATPVVSTGSDPTSEVVHRFHQRLLQLAAESLQHVEAVRREYGALVMGISHERVAALKERLRSFQQEIVEEFSGGAAVDDVILVAMQMFPVTRAKK